MAYLSACETTVCCVASFYGGGIAAPVGPGGAESTIGRTGKIKGRILCLFGEKDGYIPADQAVADALPVWQAFEEIAAVADRLAGDEECHRGAALETVMCESHRGNCT